MKNWYYVLFLAALFFFNQAFKEYVVMHGLIEGLMVGLVIAFLCKFVFNMVTKTIVFIAVIAACVVFLVSSGYIELPVNLQELFNFGCMWLNRG